MSEKPGKADSRLLRYEATRREILRREQALNVPEERQVYALRQHYDDEGGPSQLASKECAEATEANPFDFEEWRARIARAPQDWVPVEIVRNFKRKRQPPPGDFCECSGLILFSRRAQLVLGPVLSECGTFLPVTSQLGEYVGYRLDAVIDALDDERANVNWSKAVDGHRQYASSIYRYAFHTEKLDSPFFRIPLHWGLLVLHPFMHAVRAAGLTGMRFCRVWPNAGAGLYWQEKENWC